jgi:peptide/nickel transport system substrate-binding protein
VGPFEFVSRQAGDKIVLKRAENYYDRDLVKLDGLVYKAISEGSVRTASLRSGDLDFANKLPTTDIAVLQGNPELHVYQAASIGWEALMINIGNRNGIGKPYATRDVPISSDPRVRQALEMALDRNAINKVAFQGRFKPAYGPISPDTPFGSPENIPARDVDGAAALLKQAGVSSPLKLKMIIRNDEINVRIGQLIQSMAKDAGFDLAVQPMEVTSALDTANQGKFDLFLNGWSGRVDPDGNVYSFAHTSGNQNWSGVSDPALDKLLDQARAATDTADRKRLYGQAVDKLHELRSQLFLYRQVGVTAGRADIGGFEYYADDMPRFKAAGITG